MSLFLIILIALLALYLLGEVWPSYPAKANYFPPTSPDSKGWAVLSTMPDLRVSEFAPNLFDAYYAERVYLSELDYQKTREIPNPLKGYKKPPQPNYYEIL